MFCTFVTKRIEFPGKFFGVFCNILTFCLLCYIISGNSYVNSHGCRIHVQHLLFHRFSWTIPPHPEIPPDGANQYSWLETLACPEIPREGANQHLWLKTLAWKCRLATYKKISDDRKRIERTFSLDHNQIPDLQVTFPSIGCGQLHFQSTIIFLTRL